MGEGITPGRMALIVALALVAVSIGLYFVIAPTVHRSREAGRRASCASNLTQVYLAITLYANQNGGRFPDKLDTLVRDGSVPPELLTCPSSKDTPATGTTPQQQAANLTDGKGNHVSYVYLGNGLSFGSPKQLLAYEPLDHHDGEGVNALFSDGTVLFVAKANIPSMVPQLATAGGVPTSAPATAPAATRPIPGK
jgi:hypothetical protein